MVGLVVGGLVLWGLFMTHSSFRLVQSLSGSPVDSVIPITWFVREAFQ